MVKETLAYHEYEHVPVKESQYVPGLRVRRDDLAMMRCPRCKTTRRGLKHGEQTKCESCGLNMQLFGNGLHIW